MITALSAKAVAPVPPFATVTVSDNVEPAAVIVIACDSLKLTPLIALLGHRALLAQEGLVRPALEAMVEQGQAGLRGGGGAAEEEEMIANTLNECVGFAQNTLSVLFPQSYSKQHDDGGVDGDVDGAAHGTASFQPPCNTVALADTHVRSHAFVPMGCAIDDLAVEQVSTGEWVPDVAGHWFVPVRSHLSLRHGQLLMTECFCCRRTHAW